jgi:hypothetical protein
MSNGECGLVSSSWIIFRLLNNHFVVPFRPQNFDGSRWLDWKELNFRKPRHTWSISESTTINSLTKMQNAVNGSVNLQNIAICTQFHVKIIPFAYWMTRWLKLLWNFELIRPILENDKSKRLINVDFVYNTVSDPDLIEDLERNISFFNSSSKKEEFWCSKLVFVEVNLQEQPVQIRIPCGVICFIRPVEFHYVFVLFSKASARSIDLKESVCLFAYWSINGMPEFPDPIRRTI